MKKTLRIKEAIKEHKLTVNEVAKRMGISRFTLSTHINGNPSVEVLTRISDAIGCSIIELFVHEDNCNICLRTDCKQRIM